MKWEIQLAVVPGRAEPGDKAEMVNELLFGETYTVLEEKAKWVLIRGEQDGYECWIDRKQHLSSNQATNGSSHRALGLYNTIDKEGQSLIVPMASNLSDGTPCHAFLSASGSEDIREIAFHYLNTPYRWGGRTPMGIDCSGLVQNVFLIYGMQLPRDAAQQAEIGETVSFIEEAMEGDLAFFDNSEGHITHVGIVLKEKDGFKIIHASGKVRVDKLDHQGIFVENSGEYSHQLRIIKRIVD